MLKYLCMSKIICSFAVLKIKQREHRKNLNINK